MPDFNHLARVLIEIVDREVASDAAAELALPEVAKYLQKQYGEVDLPLPGETVAVSISKRKTAALFFDRVWSPPLLMDPPPKGILTYAATELDVLTAFAASTGKPELLKAPLMREYFSKHLSHLNIGSFSKGHERLIVREYLRQRGITAVPVYAFVEDRNRDYKAGDSEALIAAIEGVAIIDEKKLTWPQVQEFRQDLDSKSNLRKMRHWLDREFDGKSISFIIDEMSIRLENYERSLKKHGIETFSGIVSDLLDEKFVYGAAGMVTGAGIGAGAIGAAVAGGVLALGRVTLSITKRMIDFGDRSKVQGAEVAFVHEIKKLTK